MDKDTIQLLIHYIFDDNSYEYDDNLICCDISINKFKFTFTHYEIFDDIIRFYFDDSYVGGIFLDEVTSISEMYHN